MRKALQTLSMAMLLGFAAHAATVNTNLAVSGTVSFGTSYTLNGTATFTGGLTATGTITATLAIGATGNITGPYTITLGSNTITGTLTAPATALNGSGNVSATVTGGTGTYAGATGSFPTMPGTGSIGATGTISLSFSGAGTIVTGGGSTGPATPVISQLLNNYSLIPAGFPNYGIAQGSIFIIKGSNLSDPTISVPVLTDSTKGAGIPLTLNGASITVTVGSTTVHPGLYYAIPGQLAAVLPQNTPVGTGTITVTYTPSTGSPVSGSGPITVVAAAPGLDEYGGIAVATDNNTGALFNYTHSIAPGGLAVLWGSGLGVNGSDDLKFTAGLHAAPNITVYVGGIALTNSGNGLIYAGSSGYPGLDQVDIIIPQNVAVGCNVSVVIVSGSGANAIVGNTLTLPVAAGGGVCSDPAFGVTGDKLQTIAGQTTTKTGFVALLHDVTATQTIDAAESFFQQNTTTTTNSNAGGTYTSIGSCTVSQPDNSSGTTSTSVGLDAGTITVTGPNGSATLQGFPTTPGLSFAQLAAGFIPQSGGTFTFKGTGGKDVGSFNTTVTFPALLSWTNTSANATITRSAGATVTWTGGTPGTYVFISGGSSNQQVSGSFTCVAPQSAGTFTVPIPVLLSMPAGTGSLSVENATSYSNFTATGIDIGWAFGGSLQSIDSTYK